MDIFSKKEKPEEQLEETEIKRLMKLPSEGINPKTMLKVAKGSRTQGSNCDGLVRMHRKIWKNRQTNVYARGVVGKDVQKVVAVASEPMDTVQLKPKKQKWTKRVGSWVDGKTKFWKRIME